MTIAIVIAVLILIRWCYESKPSRRQNEQTAPRMMTVDDIPDVIDADDPRKAEYLRLLKIRIPSKHK